MPISPETEIVYGWNGQPGVVRSHSVAIARTNGKVDQFIPAYINSALFRWLAPVFLVSLLSAAMSALSGQFHAMGPAIGRDVFGSFTSGFKWSDRFILFVTRVGIVINLMARPPDEKHPTCRCNWSRNP